MIMRNMLDTFSFAVSGLRVCWLKDSSKQEVSVMAMLPKDACHLTGIQSTKLAARAERIANNKARKIGTVISTGVFIRKGDAGDLVATGIADMKWTPEVERRLLNSGMQKLV